MTDKSGHAGGLLGALWDGLQHGRRRANSHGRGHGPGHGARGPRGLGPWGSIAAVAAGLAAGAGAAHLVYRHGHKYGFELRRPRPHPAPPKVLTPEDFEEKEPGRGRTARRPEHIPHKGWTDILWRWGGSYFGDRVGFLSGGVTFFVLLSLFPTLAAFVTVYGLFADPNQAVERLYFLYSVMPVGVAEFLSGEMQRLAENSNSQLTFTLVWTVLLSLWTASGAVKVLFYGLNIAYHEVEKRHIVKYNLMCLAITLTGLVAVGLSGSLVVGVPLFLDVLGIGAEFAHLAPLRWPLLLLVYGTALTLVYRIGPCRQKARWRWLTPGAIAASFLSLGLSLFFSWYLQTFVRTASYGPLAAMMGFLLWTWLSVQIIIMGAELNAEIEHQTAIDTTTGEPLPIGERGAVVADTVGPKRGNPAALAFTLKHAEALSDRLMKRRIRNQAEPPSE